MTVIDTTIAQVRAGMGYLGHLALVKMDENTVRFHKPGRVARSVDVSYDAGMDTYTVKAHEIRNFDVTTQEWDGVYSDSMVDMVARYTAPPSRR